MSHTRRNNGVLAALLSGLALCALLLLPNISRADSTLDLNQDRYPDLLWQNANDGGIYYFLMQGTDVLGGNYLFNPGDIGPDWHIVGTPDLNRDGENDLIFQNTNDGGVYYFLMRGGNVSQGDYLVEPNQIGLEWQIVSFPDLNRDGYPDILWQNTTDGGVYYNTLRGVNFVGGDYLVEPNQVSTDWRIVATPDFNGDGYADLLWQNTYDGGIYANTLRRTTFLSGDYLVEPNQISPEWEIAGTPDLNRDGSPDLLFRNLNDGAVYYFLLDGFTIGSGDYLFRPNEISTDWNLVGLH